MPFDRVPYLPYDEFRALVDEVPAEHRRRQSQTAQLTWVVASFGGAKRPLEEYYTGYARDRTAGDPYAALPRVWREDLAAGLALGLVSQEVYDSLTL